MALVYYSNPRFINNTIIDNHVLNSDDFYETGVITSFISKPLLYNNIINNNSDFYFEENQLFSVKKFNSANNCYDFEFSTYDMIINDLELVENSDNIYSLPSNSPLINGSAELLPFGITLPALDILGNVRNSGALVDIGATEYNTTSNDQNVDIFQQNMAIYPNPFKQETTIMIDVKNNNNTQIGIYNIKGALVYKFSSKNIKKGSNRLTWKGVNNHNRAVASGIYFVRTINENKREVQKVLYIK